MVSISAIKPILTQAVNYGKRGAKVFAPTVLGTGQEAMSKAYTRAFKGATKNPLKGDFWKTLWEGTKRAGRAAEGNAKAVAQQGGFWKNSWKALKSIPSDIGKNWKAASGITGKLGSVFKTLGSKMPLIGSLMIIAFELPNIIKATADEGLMQGVAEIGKAAVKLGAATVFGALGTALGGPIGGIVGFTVGDWLAGKIVGKNYSERKAEEQEKLAQATQQNAINPFMNTGFPVGAMTPQQLMAFQQQLYGNNSMNDDFMYMATQPKLNVQA